MTRHVALRLGLARAVGTLQSGRAVVGGVRRGLVDLLISAVAGLAGHPYPTPPAPEPEAAIAAVITAALDRGMPHARVVAAVNDALESAVRPGGQM